MTSIIGLYERYKKLSSCTSRKLQTRRKRNRDKKTVATTKKKQKEEETNQYDS